MMKTQQPPTTLLQAVRYFADPDRALAFMVELRWPDGQVICPNCGGTEVSFLSSRRVWKCKADHPGRQFSIKVGTIFADSPIGLDKWLPAMWMIANCKNGISSYELGRALGVTQKTAWFMLHRIRLAMQTGTFEMGGEVEADETFIGGKARNMHKDRRDRRMRKYGTLGKVAVMGLLERHGPDQASRVKTRVVPNVGRKALHGMVREHVAPGSTMFTDALASYRGLDEEYVHQVIDHAECYAKGRVHTNSMENFWSLLKRAIKGTYVSVEPFHLFRYLDEQSFRFNRRKATDADRFVGALRAILGKRLTYKQLTGAGCAAAAT